MVSVPKSHSAQKITLQKEKEETAEDLETVSRSLELQHATDEARPGFIDSLEQLFGGGAESGTDLLEHPCPPGKKSKLMKTDLMSFQVSFLLLFLRVLANGGDSVKRSSLDDQNGASKVTRDSQ